MESFLQRIVSLGEEDGAARKLSPCDSASVFSAATTGLTETAATRASSIDCAARFSNEWRHTPGSTELDGAAGYEGTALEQWRRTLATQKNRYDDLLAESHRLRAEYDAYRFRMDREVRQQKQQAMHDRHMLEELRLAGSNGTVDEAYVAEMKRQLSELQRQVSESTLEAEKSYRRQREAEEARIASEKSKKEELEALAARISLYRTSASVSEELVLFDAEEADKAAVLGRSDDNTELVLALTNLALRKVEIEELRAEIQQAKVSFEQKLEEKEQETQMLRGEIENWKEKERALVAVHYATQKREENDNADKAKALKTELEAAREELQKMTALQSTLQITQQELAAKKEELEERTKVKDREVQMLRASFQSQQAVLENSRAEHQELKLALYQAQEETRSLQLKLEHTTDALRRNEHQLASREEDILDLVKDRQNLRALLQQGEEETSKVRQQLTRMQRAEVDHEIAVSAAPASLGGNAVDSSRQDPRSGCVECGDADAKHFGEGAAGTGEHQLPIHQLQDRIEMLQSELAKKDVALRRQQSQLQEIEGARMELLKAKEKMNLVAAQSVDHIRRLEEELQALSRGDSATKGLSTPSALGPQRRRLEGSVCALTDRQKFIMEAKCSAESFRAHRVRQMRCAFFSVLLLVVSMTLYTSVSLAPYGADELTPR